MAYEDIRWASLGGLSEEPPQRVKDFGYTTSTGTNEGTSEAPILQWTNWQFNKIYDAIENLAAGGLPPDGGGTLITERSGVNVILNGDFSEGTAYWSFSGTAAELIVEDEPLALSGKVGVWTPTGASTMTADPVVIPLPIQNVLGAVDFQYKTDSDDFSVLVYQGANILGNYPIPSSAEYANLFDEVPLPAAGEQVFVRLETTSAGSITLSGIQLGATGLEAVLDGTTMSPSLAGEVVDYAGNTVPSGWLECDGSVLEKTTYPDLYNAIGDTYATANYFSDDGSLNTYSAPPSGSFRLPDYRNAYLCDSSVSGLGDALEDATAVNGLSASASSLTVNKNQWNSNQNSHTHKVMASYSSTTVEGTRLSFRRSAKGDAASDDQQYYGAGTDGTSMRYDSEAKTISWASANATGTASAQALTGDAVTRPKSFIVKKIIRCWNSTASGMGAPIATETEYGLVKLEPPTPTPDPITIETKTGTLGVATYKGSGSYPIIQQIKNFQYAWQRVGNMITLNFFCDFETSAGSISAGVNNAIDFNHYYKTADLGFGDVTLDTLRSSGNITTNANGGYGVINGGVRVEAGGDNLVFYFTTPTKGQGGNRNLVGTANLYII